MGVPDGSLVDLKNISKATQRDVLTDAAIQNLAENHIQVMLTLVIQSSE